MNHATAKKQDKMGDTVWKVWEKFRKRIKNLVLKIEIIPSKKKKVKRSDYQTH